MRLAIFTLVAGLWPVQAFAGWNSGGGKLLKHATNPWFLENTADVEYCIDFDQNYFDVGQERLEQLVGEALSEWKLAFAYAKDRTYEEGELEPFGQLRVATQNFWLTKCHADVDIRFQFGKLSKTQAEKYFNDPRKFVGTAVRTHYDLKQLTSKGFVYIAPMDGPLRPELQNMHPNPWIVDNNSILKVIIMHEIGHIFGMKHENGLMAEVISERLMNEDFVNSVIRINYLPTLRPIEIFRSRKDVVRKGCGAKSPVYEKENLGIETNKPCTKVDFKVFGEFDARVTIYQGDSKHNYDEVGEANLKGGANSTLPVVFVYLPAEQEVFTKTPKVDFGPYLMGEEREGKSSYRGTYVGKNGSADIPMMIDLVPWSDPAEQKVTIFHKGRFMTNPFILY